MSGTTWRNRPIDAARRVLVLSLICQAPLAAKASDIPCQKERHVLLTTGGTSLGPYLLEALSAQGAGWLTAQEAPTSLRRDYGVATARDSFVNCVLQAQAKAAEVLREGSSAEKIQQEATVAVAQAKVARYERIARQGVPQLRNDAQQAPVLVSLALESAAHNLASQFGDAPRQLLRYATAKAVQDEFRAPQYFRGGTEDVLKNLDENIKSLRLAEPAQAFVREAALDVMRRELDAANGQFQDFKRRLVIDKDAEELFKTSNILERAAGQLLMKELSKNKEISALVDQAELLTGFVTRARNITEQYEKGIQGASTALQTSIREGLPKAATSLQVDLGKLSPSEQLKQLTQLSARVASGEVQLSLTEGEDLKFRKNAAGVASDFDKIAGDLQGLSNFLGKTKGGQDAARYVSAASTVASTVSQVAQVMAAGAMGPVGWVTIGMSLIQAGGNIGAMFGGGGGESVMASSLKRLSEQIADLEKLLIEQHRQTRALLEAQDGMSRGLLNLALNELYSKYEYCTQASDFFHTKSIVSAADLVREFRKDSSSTGPQSVRLCVTELLEKPDSFSSHLSTTAPALGPAFHFSTAALNRAIERRPTFNLEQQAFNEAMWQLRLALLNHSAQKQLLHAAAKRANLDSERLWNQHLQPARTWRDVQVRFAASKPPVDLAGREPSALSEFNLTAQMFGVTSLPPKAVLSELVKEPLIPAATLTVLLAASKLGDTAEFLDAKTSTFFSTPDVLAGLPTQTLLERRQKGNGWLYNWAPLAMGSLSWATLNRGEYLVPLASDLIRWAELPAPQRCTEEKELESDTLCKELGNKQIFGLAVAARRLAREIPEFRANVAAWRVREALERTPAKERPDGTRETAAYARALATADPQLVESLFPAENLIRVPVPEKASSIALSDRPSRTEHWYMRLSGQCLGFARLGLLEQNAKSTCNGLNACTPAPKAPASYEKDLEWDIQKMASCVLAPLPLPERVEDGVPRTDTQTQTLMDAGLSYLAQTAYYRRLDGHAVQRLGSPVVDTPESRAEFTTYIRPPSVPLWRATVLP